MFSTAFPPFILLNPMKKISESTIKTFKESPYCRTCGCNVFWVTINATMLATIPNCIKAAKVKNQIERKCKSSTLKMDMDTLSFSDITCIECSNCAEIQKTEDFYDREFDN